MLLEVGQQFSRQAVPRVSVWAPAKAYKRVCGLRQALADFAAKVVFNLMMLVEMPPQVPLSKVLEIEPVSPET